MPGQRHRRPASYLPKDVEVEEQQVSDTVRKEEIEIDDDDDGRGAR